jgi:hypothetical protein
MTAVGGQTTVGDIMGAPCLIARNDCRVRQLTTVEVNDAGQRTERALIATALSWIWVEAATPCVRLGIAGGFRDGDCECLMRFALSLVDDLLHGRPSCTGDETPPAVLARAANVLSYALAADNGRLGLIQVEAPQRPSWLPPTATGRAL